MHWERRAKIENTPLVFLNAKAKKIFTKNFQK
jgi:hypothetical protein